MELMRLLLANDADVDVKTTQHNTALIVAVMNDQTATVRLLLDHDAEVNDQNALKETAMHEACKNGSTAIVKLLLGKGAIFTSRDASRLHRHLIKSLYAFKGLSFWNSHPEGYEILCGHTAFEYAIGRGQTDIVEMLLEADDSSVLSKATPVPLLFAAYANNLPMVELLLQQGAEVNAKDTVGRTALFGLQSMAQQQWQAYSWPKDRK
jgi:ankyrin repeat protein